MKKYLNISLFYAIAAMIGGVFCREFTKWNGYDGVTVLGKVHTHLFMMGMMVFLMTALFAEHYELQKQKTFRIFMPVYNIGLAVTVVMMVVRGIAQVLNISLSSAANASISGIAGIGHMLTGVGIILFLVSLKKAVGNRVNSN